MKVGDVDADVMGLSDSIASISSELDEKISSTDADKRFHPKIAANELPTSSVNGLFQFIFDTNMKLNLMQIDLNLKSNVRALESYQPLVTTNTLSMSVIAGLVDHVIQTGMALAAMTKKINALTVVPQHIVLLSSTVNLPNLNLSIVHTRWRTTCRDLALSYTAGGTLFTVNEPGDYQISCNITVTDGLANERALFYLAIRLYNGGSRNDTYTEHVLDNAYYRDDSEDYDALTMGSCTRLYFSDAMIASRACFEIVTVRIDGADDRGIIGASSTLSCIKIERVAYTIG